jgi:hypothetical protein
MTNPNPILQDLDEIDTALDELNEVKEFPRTLGVSDDAYGRPDYMRLGHGEPFTPDPAQFRDVVSRRSVRRDLYTPFDPRDRQNQSEPAETTKQGQSVTIKDLFKVVQRSIAKYNTGPTVIRWLGDSGVVFEVSLNPGNFSGTSMPSISGLTSEMTVDLRKDYQQAVLELVDQSDISGPGPGAFRRRGYWRLRIREGDGRGRHGGGLST